MDCWHMQVRARQLQPQLQHSFTLVRRLGANAACTIMKPLTHERACSLPSSKTESPYHRPKGASGSTLLTLMSKKMQIGSSYRHKHELPLGTSYTSGFLKQILCSLISKKVKHIATPQSQHSQIACALPNHGNSTPTRSGFENKFSRQKRSAMDNVCARS